MIEVTRELLLYVLIGLIFILVALIVMIFRRRSGIEEVIEEDPSEKEPEALIEPETGETDAFAIKDRLMAEKSKKVEKEPPEPVEKKPEKPEPAKSMLNAKPVIDSVKKFVIPVFSRVRELRTNVSDAPEPPEAVKKAAPKKDEAPSGEEKKTESPSGEEKKKPEHPVMPAPALSPAPPVPKTPEPVYKEGEIEQGIDSEEYQPQASFPGPDKESVKSSKDTDIDEFDYVDLHDYEGPVRQEEPKPEAPVTKPAAPAVPAPSKKEPSPIPAPAAKPPEPRVHAPDFSPKKLMSKSVEFKETPEEILGESYKIGKHIEVIDSLELSKDEKSFLNQTIAIEGDLQLSSKGNDFWYVLFDKTGSAVVRSDKEIHAKKCRITAKVEKTRLGQVYLNTIKYEKM